VRTKGHFSFNCRACRLKWEQNPVLSLSRAHFVLESINKSVVFSHSEKMLASGNNKITNCKVILFSHELWYFSSPENYIFSRFFALE
jgi:hypothetical protein